MAEKSEVKCALCAAGKVVLTGKKWPEHRVLFRHGGVMFECHVRCTPATRSQAKIVVEVKRNLETVAPLRGLRRVRESLGPDE